MAICPKCGRKFERLLAVSREDNETMICDECGTAEALQDALDACGTKEDCFIPEKNNPYPLCTGRSLEQCKNCQLRADWEPADPYGID